ncbi:MAG: DNA/RNA non-specific endonuclease [Flavobacteriales bacterium]|nr:DNA/RNA non-specific endonuclease [Flavobacteriales bacterium]
MRTLLAAWAVLLLTACQKYEVPEPEPEPPVVDDGRDPALAMGNPSAAVASIVIPTNYLIEHPQYSLAYDNSRGTARWVSWHLAPAWLGDAERCDCFVPDPLVPDGYYTVYGSTYLGTGFDRGHICPSADRVANDADNAATFLMTNMLPQAPALNQGRWVDLEIFCRSLVYDGNELYIVSGGYGNGGEGSQGYASTLDNGNITVPARCWKVMLVLPLGNDDLDRVDADTRLIAVDMPNDQGANALQWYEYRVSVDQIEGATGLDFFSALPEALQDQLEGSVDTGPVQ